MKRKECLDKIQEVINNLDTLLYILKLSSKDTIRLNCEVYADEAQNLTDALNTLYTNYGNEAREEFSKQLNNE